MERSEKFDLIVRILIPLILIPVLGLGTRMHRGQQAQQRAQLALTAGAHATAAEDLAEAAALLPRRAGLWEAAAQQAYQANDLALAQEYFLQAQAQDGLSVTGQVQLGEVYRLNGDLGAALQIWEAVEASAGDIPVLYTSLAESQRQLGHYPQAIEALQSLTYLEPGNAAAQYELGLLLAVFDPKAAPAHLAEAAGLDEDLASSAQALERVVRRALTAEDSAYTYVLIGQELASQEMWELAEIAFDKSTTENPEYAEAWAYLGEARQHNGGDGLKELQYAIIYNSGSLAANILIGTYWQRHDHLETALYFLQKAAALEPDNPAVQVQLGSIQRDLGDLAAALGHYQRATELAPANGIYWKALAAFAVDNEVFVEDVGLPAAQRALELDADDLEALVLRGRAQFLLGDLAAAQESYAQIIAGGYDYAPAYLHMGILYLEEGLLVPAREHLVRAMTLDPDGPVGAQAQMLLEKYLE
ncbi:MAG: tetratricopeptide repeat protein [Anaerolineales bacterium]|nr:tetratricopeptide repeat protein [Anaerolineales bacterium]